MELTTNATEFLQFPVIVSIPQGPLLPLTLAAVHAANRYPTASAILIPCDLTTPLQSRMFLETIQPTLILVANEPDAARIRQQLSHNNNTTSHVRHYRPNVPVWQAARPRVIDVLHEWVIPFSAQIHDHIQHIQQQQQPSNHSMRTPSFLDQIDAHDPITDRAPRDRLSHIVYTSGTSGTPKGCCSSISALQQYVQPKNQRHAIQRTSYVALASPLPFDPCLGDIVATWTAGATLVLLSVGSNVISSWPVTHILCTPTWWKHYGGDDQQQRWPQATWQVIALGGEAIPPRLRKSTLPIYATYGVTEACVYQTMGPVLASSNPANHVGTPFSGMTLTTVSETNPLEFLPNTSVGEIVLSGTLIDHLSGYWNRDDAAHPKFVPHNQVYYYRTGDRGYFDTTTNDWVLLGRIEGQEGMVKYNGVRVELSEIERALLQAVGVVHDCIVVAQKEHDDTSTSHTLVAYFVLEGACRLELSLLSSNEEVQPPALLCTSGPLLTLLHGHCQQAARVVPTLFVIVPSLPISPTGKRTTKGLPHEWIPMDAPEHQTPLREYGPPVGQWLAESLLECLNLQQHRSVLTVTAAFGTLGGDSLAATRVVRALYAHHAAVDNTRFLGGEYGTLPGEAFSPVHLLRARHLGAYVDYLVSQGVGMNNSQPTDSTLLAVTSEQPKGQTGSDSNNTTTFGSDAIWYDALLQALQQGHCEIAMALLTLGAPAHDPSLATATSSNNKKPRLGNISSRNERRKHFQSTPLHLACVQGRHSLVSYLLDKGARWNTPDASGLYPLHLVACSRNSDCIAEQEERWKCLQCLFAAGAPLPIRDGNQQSLLHAAARAGHFLLLQQLWMLWQGVLSTKSESLNWRDVWSRTAVHWAVLNGHAEALSVLLLEAGCDPQPDLPKHSKRSSVALETPLEMNDRVHATTNPVLHSRLQTLLQQALARR